MARRGDRRTGTLSRGFVYACPIGFLSLAREEGISLVVVDKGPHTYIGVTHRRYKSRDAAGSLASATR